jgi:hypothetical protein
LKRILPLGILANSSLCVASCRKFVQRNNSKARKVTELKEIEISKVQFCFALMMITQLALDPTNEDGSSETRVGIDLSLPWT